MTMTMTMTGEIRDEDEAYDMVLLPTNTATNTSSNSNNTTTTTDDTPHEEEEKREKEKENWTDHHRHHHTHCDFTVIIILLYCIVLLLYPIISYPIILSYHIVIVIVQIYLSTKDSIVPTNEVYQYLLYKQQQEGCVNYNVILTEGVHGEVICSSENLRAILQTIRDKVTTTATGVPCTDSK